MKASLLVGVPLVRQQVGQLHEDTGTELNYCPDLQ